LRENESYNRSHQDIRSWEYLNASSIMLSMCLTTHADKQMYFI
jgi:hypothetical protein